VLLALVFGLGFVFLGIGSGSNGITDALQNAFNFGKTSGGTSISSLEKKTQKHPLDAKAWRDLATAYETKQRTNDAIVALSQYTSLRPKDGDALAELASQYGRQANQYATDYQSSLQASAVLTPPFAAFPPASTSPLGKALNDPKALQDPISATLREQAQATQQTAISNYQTSVKNAQDAYQKLAKLTPKDPTAQFQLAQAAESAGDTKVALAAYKRVVQLVPLKTDSLRTDAEARIKALSPPAKK
jgi:cytochrome c-type biogenesis protein CcmH/NrfG